MTREMILGGRTFRVPPLPLGHNIEAYPLLRKLSNNDLAGRWFDPGPTEEDLADLSAVLYICAKAANPKLSVKAFRDLPITPPEMIVGFAVARYQSGGWVPAPEGAAPGERKGSPRPRKSTSAASSAN